jgi:hypothetical protein
MPTAWAGLSAAFKIKGPDCALSRGESTALRRGSNFNARVVAIFGFGVKKSRPRRKLTTDILSYARRP